MASLLRRWASLAAGLQALLLLGPGAAALPTGYDLQITVQTDLGQALGGADLDALSDLGLIAEGSNPVQQTQSAWLTGPADLGLGWSIDSWQSSIKLDPFITNNFTLTNNTGGTAIFTITVSSLIPAFNVSEIIQSTIQLSVLDDDNAGGATLTSKPGVDVYQGLVNGGQALGLLIDPYSLSCTSPFDCAVLGNGEDTAGVLSQAFGPVVATEIGITITFQLSDGDSAQVLSRFEVVPEPGSGLLLSLGLGALALRRRR